MNQFTDSTIYYSQIEIEKDLVTKENSSTHYNLCQLVTYHRSEHQGEQNI